jgi:hypothetical protein
MANLKSDVTHIINWLHQALDMVIGFIQAGNMPQAIALIQDVRDVISSYLGAAQTFIPEGAIEPMPGNFWRKLSWIARNTGWIQAFAMLTSGSNPFDPAKARAAEVAAKWGFKEY